MNRRFFLKHSFLTAALGSMTAGSSYYVAMRRNPKPNIIVIFTDDHGFADLGCQGRLNDIKTPNIDKLAADGVRCTHGYVTAPQCVPSRAGLMTGRYQQRFGTDDNQTQPPPLEEVMLAERLKNCGYISGMVGKWHLDPNSTQRDWLKKYMPEKLDTPQKKKFEIPFEKLLPYFPVERGFDETFYGPLHNYWATYDLNGNNLKAGGQWHQDDRYRLDVQTEAALTFIDRHKEKPFFLYLAYFAPHVPLEATQKYLDRFPGDMPQRRRYALAMISAIDDGVGLIRDKLKEYELLDNTIIFFISDNGAPLKIKMEDIPLSSHRGAWDGSRNDPLVGEKGMLSEGGIRVPFIVSWPDKLCGGGVFNQPVISLDVAASSMAAAGQNIPQEIDGINIIPYLAAGKTIPDRNLYWRFWNQSAVRRGRWKFLKAGSRAEYLFDLEDKDHEKVNLIDKHPQIAAELKTALEKWAAGLYNPGVPDGELNRQEAAWFAHYFGLKNKKGV
jgi:arylsulfatase A-like enzyme